MTTFESERYNISSGNASIAEFLTNLENLEHLLPTDRIEDLKLTNDTGSFKIKGLAEISIALESSSNERIVYKNSGEKPFLFRLEVELQEAGEETMASVQIHADVNSFMAMMMKTPLTNFLNSLGTNLQSHFQST